MTAHPQFTRPQRPILLLTLLIAGLALLAALSVAMPFLGRARARARYGTGAT